MTRRLAAAISAIRGSRWSEMRDVAEAQLALLGVQTMRWMRPAGDLVDVAAFADDVGHVSAEDMQTSERLVLAMDRAARYGVCRPQCLSRALALSRMLSSRGITAHRVRIGVRKEDGAFSAHAWVELGYAVVGDTIRNTRAYAPLADVSLNSGGLFRSNQPGQDPSRSPAIEQVNSAQ